MIAIVQKHLLILQIIVPLLGAPLCTMFRKKTAWLFATLVSWVTFALSCTVLYRVMHLPKGVHSISYRIGNWDPNIGIVYKVDPINAFVLLIVTAIAAVVLPFAYHSVQDEIAEEKHHLFYAGILLCLTGLLGITITGDAFNVFVFLEISSLSSYALISMGRSRRALTAAFQYLVMGTIGGTFILIGIGMLYMVTGTLNMAEMASILAQKSAPRTELVGFAFLTVGISIKLAFFPLHFWLPNAYTYAPSVITAFLAATATKVSFYLFLRFFFTIFGAPFVIEKMQINMVLLPLSLLAIFVASTVAIYQNNVKRLLAYSSIAQIGYMVLGLSFFSVRGLGAGIVHLFNHALMKGALFLALGAMFYRIGSVHIDDLRGIGKRMPVTTFAFVMGGLSLIGVPLTVGFVSKWNLLAAALEKGLWPVAALILLSSLLAVIYVWRVVEVAYFREPLKEMEVKEAPLSMLVPTWLLIAASVYFGVSTSITVGVAEKAAKLLLGVTP